MIPSARTGREWSDQSDQKVTGDLVSPADKGRWAGVVGEGDGFETVVAFLRLLEQKWGTLKGAPGLGAE